MKPNAKGLTPEALKCLESFNMMDIVRGGGVKGSDYVNIFLDKFVTGNLEMLKVKDRIRKLSEVDHPVMIIGPSGTGKELLAKALHGQKEADRFVAVNCAGIPDQLAESELFGHVKGAFTGAVKDRRGHFECAENGTIFLDEVGELSPAVQAKLLRTIQEGIVRPVGADKEVDVNCRIVCATHQPITEWVEYGRFREDLFYRLSTFTLRTTPLVERKKDVPLIVEALDLGGHIKPHLDEFVERIRIKTYREGGEEKETYLPGNVRSLEQLIHRFTVLGLWPDQD